jgi:hypothetical protein
MTEVEWLACTDPTPMLEFLRGKVSDRKLRLFACACCRRIWHLLTDERSRKAVEVGEWYAEGLASEEDLAEGRSAANAAFYAAGDVASEAEVAYDQDPSTVLAYATADAAHHAACSTDFTVMKTVDPAFAAINVAAETADAVAAAAYAACHDDRLSDVATHAARADEHNVQAALLRDIFGNPFRFVAIDPAWLCWNDATVVKLAQAIYDERRFEDTPILADALERAGCTDADLLVHCRQPGEHVRGCWVVDLLLEKA